MRYKQITRVAKEKGLHSNRLLLVQQRFNQGAALGRVGVVDVVGLLVPATARAVLHLKDTKYYIMYKSTFCHVVNCRIYSTYG